MDDLDMYDAYRMPPPSQATLDWLASANTHELTPRPDFVQWEVSQTHCPAFDNLRREVIESEKSAPKPALAYGFMPDYENTPSILPSTSSSTPGAASGSTTRRRPSIFPPQEPSVAQPTSTMKEAAGVLNDMLRSVMISLDQTAQLKKRHLENQRLLAKKEQLQAKPARPLIRAKSSHASAHVSKKLPLKRHTSAGGLDRPRTGDIEPSNTRLQFTDGHEFQSNAAGGSRSELLAAAADLSDDPPFQRSFAQSSSSKALLLPKPYARPPPKTSDTAVFAMPPPPAPPRSRLRTVPAPAPAPSPSSVSLKPSQPRPACSQPTTRAPPVLGMRRSNTYGGTATAAAVTSSPGLQSSQTLPTKQRGFKPPFARPLPSQADSQSHSPSSQPTTADKDALLASKVRSSSKPSVRARSPSPSPSPSPARDADSSYGEISFEMDIVELEATMRQYDEV